MSLKLNLVEIKNILKQINIDLEIVNKNKFLYFDVSYLLNIVCEKNFQSAVDYLIQNGADINADGIHDRRPLWWAVWHQNEKLVKLFIMNKCEINFVDKETGYTPLDLAVCKGNEKICKLLLSAGAVHLERNFWFKLVENPIFLCIKRGSVSILQTLINHGFQINTPNNFGWTPLILAVEYHNNSLVTILLKNQADLNVSSKGYSPLRSALDHDFDDTLQLLIIHAFSFICRDISHLSGYAFSKHIQNYICKVNSNVANGMHPLLYSVIMKAEKSAIVLLTNGSKFKGDLTTLISLAYMEGMWKFTSLLIRINPGRYSWDRFKSTLCKNDNLFEVYPISRPRNCKALDELEKAPYILHSLKQLSRSSLMANFGCHILYQLKKRSVLPEELFDYVISIICDD